MVEPRRATRIILLSKNRVALRVISPNFTLQLRYSWQGRSFSNKASGLYNLASV